MDPFDRLKVIESIGCGGFAIIHSAIWIDGKPDGFREKKGSSPIKVALKKLTNLGPEKMGKALINEVSYLKNNISHCIFKALLKYILLPDICTLFMSKFCSKYYYKILW